MSNAILLNWLNFSAATARLPGKERPVTQKQISRTLEEILEWYRKFTDIPEDQLDGAKKQFEESSKQFAKTGKDARRGAVHTAIEFLRAYLEPVEIVNMSWYGADKQEAQGLAKMTKKLAAFHTEKFDSLKRIIDWLEEVDPLFPAATFRNKLACCFSDAKQKPCYTNCKHCVFESSLSWVRTPTAMLTGTSTGIRDCCLGATLSSCSGGTLYCDCVRGKTGCDCQAPHQFCSQNGRFYASAAGFSHEHLSPDYAGKDSSASSAPKCLVLDPAPESGCTLDEVPQPFPGSLCTLLDATKGRFTTRQGSRFNLGRLVITSKDCTQTGFCPPKGGGCGGLC